MIAQIIFERLVAQHETKTPALVHIDRFLQIQLVEVDRVLDRFRSALLNGYEMQLSVQHPVVGHAVDGAVVQTKLRKVTRRGGVDVERVIDGPTQAWIEAR